MEIMKKTDNIICMRENDFEVIEKLLLTEYKVPLFINDQKVYSFNCTPEYLEEMAIGYMYTSEMIRDISEIKELKVNKNAIHVQLDQAADKKAVKISKDRTVFCVNDILKYGKLFYKRSVRHEVTKASHKSLLCVPSNHCFYEADDISRHNTIDKVVGIGLKNKVDFSHSFLIFSGRVPMDIVEKIVGAGIGMLVGRSNPTYDAIFLTRKKRITLCGNLLDDSFSIYNIGSAIIENSAVI